MSDLGQSHRQAEPGDEAAQGLVRRRRAAEQAGDLPLALAVHRLVPPHHRRQRQAGGDAVRHPARAAQDVAQAVARPHRHAGPAAHHRQPRRLLAGRARREVAGVAPDGRQAFGQHPHGLPRHRVREGLRGARAPALRRVVHGADAGGEEEVRRRFQCRRRVQHHRFRHHEGSTSRCLRPAARSVTPACGANSAADSVVGTATMRGTGGARRPGRSGVCRASPRQREGRRAPSARAKRPGRPPWRRRSPSRRRPPRPGPPAPRPGAARAPRRPPPGCARAWRRGRRRAAARSPRGRQRRCGRPPGSAWSPAPPARRPRAPAAAPPPPGRRGARAPAPAIGAGRASFDARPGGAHHLGPEGDLAPDEGVELLGRGGGQGLQALLRQALLHGGLDDDACGRLEQPGAHRRGQAGRPPQPPPAPDVEGRQSRLPPSPARPGSRATPRASSGRARADARRAPAAVPPAASRSGCARRPPAPLARTARRRGKARG